jgi:hypothetical protein
VPEGVFERWLLRPTAQPTEPGEGGETSTSKLVVPVVFHPQNPPRIVCATEGPANLLASQQWLRVVPMHGSLRFGTT